MLLTWIYVKLSSGKHEKDFTFPALLSLLAVRRHSRHNGTSVYVTVCVHSSVYLDICPGLS